MGLLRGIGQLFRRRTESMKLRRWEAARTNRLNKGRWQRVTDRPITLDLAEALPALRSRVVYEAANDPMLEGVIETHLVDTIGRDGPVLQVQSDDTAYAEDLEDIWQAWWASPEASGRMSGVEVLDLWLHSLWTAGEFLDMFITDAAAAGPVRMRLHGLHSRQLATPIGRFDEATAMGVKRDELGRPVEYFVHREPLGEYAIATSLEYDVVPAAQMLHEFRVRERGQARGYPWLSSVINTSSAVRQYDGDVLATAKAAANHGVVLSTKHPDAVYLEVNEETELERGMISTLPPGWEATEIKPEQPSTRYVEYRAERHREYGRPGCMPQMIVRADASGHNYSSARFDAQSYFRANAKLQGWLERRALNRLVDAVAREARLGDRPALRRRRGAAVRYLWTWPSPPHVDPLKEAQAMEIRRRNGVTTLTDELSATGRDVESHLERLKREIEAFEAAGVPYPQPQSAGVTINAGGPASGSDDDGEGRGDPLWRNRELALNGLNGAGFHG